ncbi:MAG: TonB family protein [Deltaproteobacteria bacterium]|nr:TonB family protein [Deltaproteobacteria bacterium]
MPCPVPPPCRSDQPCPTRPPCPVQPGVFTDPSWLGIDYHRVSVTVENQIAQTNVDMQFTNRGQALAEGTFVFPLPMGAAVDQLTMFVNGQAIEARILPADEARGIYNEIVRQYRDPALLEYIGSSAIQANVFPIPPGENRRIQISYSQVLEVENGLIHYIYPLTSSRAMGGRGVDQFSLSIDVTSLDPISSIYSPSHPVAVSRASDTHFRAGFEQNGFFPVEDFSLYYGIANDAISLNLLSYRESATEDGFFMLLVQPPLEVDPARIVPKDVILVVDQSGSMQGPKWEQAQQAAAFVLDNLNPEDRFNVVVFSTGARVFSDSLESPAAAAEAADWVNSLQAEGGTDINLALNVALEMADTNRPTTVLFMTDGYIGNEAEIFKLVDASIGDARLFSLGVGSAPNRYLLDGLARAGRGTVTYAAVGEDLDPVVERFYERIATPVLGDIEIDWAGLEVSEVYPANIPDLFAGQPLTVYGRYEGKPKGTIRVKAKARGQALEIPVEFDLASAADASGVGSMWARSKVDALLGYPTPAYPGESSYDEAKKDVTALALEYRLLTQFTSFVAVDERVVVDPDGTTRTVVQPLELPLGTTYEGFGVESGAAYGIGGLGLIGSGGGGSGSGYGRGQGVGFGGKGQRVPVVRQAKAEVTGSLDKDIIRRIVRAHINEVRACYNQLLSSDPNASGKVAVRWKIGSDGAVTEVSVTTNEVDEALGKCMVKAIKAWKFPKPAGGGTVTITYPFSFEPG